MWFIFGLVIPHKPLVVHCGAGHAEEAALYEKFGNTGVIWIECNPNLVKRINETIATFSNQEVIIAALWSYSGKNIDFWIANNLGSSSLCRPIEHKTIFPYVKFESGGSLVTSRLDELFPTREFSGGLLVLDLQGAEKEALLGAEGIISKFDYILTEFQTREVYENGSYLNDIQAIIGSDFKLVAQNVSRIHGYGNAFFARGLSPGRLYVFRMLWCFLKLVNVHNLFVRRVLHKLSLRS